MATPMSFRQGGRRTAGSSFVMKGPYLSVLLLSVGQSLGPHLPPFSLVILPRRASVLACPGDRASGDACPTRGPLDRQPPPAYPVFRQITNCLIIEPRRWRCA